MGSVKSCNLYQKDRILWFKKSEFKGQKVLKFDLGLLSP